MQLLKKVIKEPKVQLLYIKAESFPVLVSKDLDYRTTKETTFIDKRGIPLKFNDDRKEYSWKNEKTTVIHLNGGCFLGRTILDLEFIIKPGEQFDYIYNLISFKDKLNDKDIEFPIIGEYKVKKYIGGFKNFKEMSIYPLIEVYVENINDNEKEFENFLSLCYESKQIGEWIGFYNNDVTKKIEVYTLYKNHYQCYFSREGVGICKEILGIKALKKKRKRKEEEFKPTDVPTNEQIQDEQDYLKYVTNNSDKTPPNKKVKIDEDDGLNVNEMIMIQDYGGDKK